MKNKNLYNTIIIGGGASGLICGIILAEKMSDLLILEKNSRVGKKLSATGNGQGNLTNENLSINNYHGGTNFAQYSINVFDNHKLINFFEDLGGYFISDERGRFYPASMQASSLTDLLRFKIDNLNVNIHTETNVTEILKNKVFEIKTQNGDIFYSENVVLACGGMAAKQFGTDGSAYSFAKMFGHTIINTAPSLVQLKTENIFIKGLKGIKANCIAYANSNGKMLKKDEGEVLFTDYGLSGNVVFQLSSYLINAQNPQIRLEFLSQLPYNELLKILAKKITDSNIPIEELFTGILNKQLGKAILKYAGIENLTEKAINDTAKIEKIAKAVKSFDLRVTGNLGYDYAQVTKGGVNTNEIDSKTMMSKIVNNLYFCGEIIDIDGDCGGYNLQWAFSSGYVAANSILRGKNGNIQ